MSSLHPPMHTHTAFHWNSFRWMWRNGSLLSPMPSTARTRGLQTKSVKQLVELVQLKNTVMWLFSFLPQISELHSALVRWVVGLLLAMTETQPKQEEGEEEGKGGGEGESRGERESHRHTHTTADLKTDLTTLLEYLTNFTTGLTRCVDSHRISEVRNSGVPL